MRRYKMKVLCEALMIVVAIVFINQAIAGQTKEITCSGKVVDNDGRPIAKAKVALYYNHSRWGLGNRIVEETSSATDGSFVFKRPLTYSSTAGYPYGRDSFVILATHPDYALGWYKIARDQEKPGYELVLTEPKSQTVTVTDHAGNPLPGARVWPYNIGSPTDSEPLFHDYLSLPTDAGIVGGITGADGKAVINNLPRTRWSFYATLAGHARGLSFTGKKPIRLSKAGTVRGSLLNEDGQPVEGALIRLRASWMWQFFLARTDSQGRFHFDDLPAYGWDMSPWGTPGGASGQYTVGIEHDSYTTWETQIDLEAGQTIDDLVIDALAGTLVKCRVLEVETNRPVGGARINGRNECGRIDSYSDPEGMFAIRVLPGKTMLMFQSPPEGVYIDGGMSLRREDIPESRLDFDADGAEMAVTMRTPRIAGRLTSVRGVVLGPDGEPQDKAVVHAAAGRFQAAGRGYVPPVGVDKDGRFKLKDVPAGRRLYIYAATNDGKSAGTAELDVTAEPENTPLIRAKLQATQRASIVVKDQTGFLLSSTRLQIGPMVKGQRMPRCERTVSTDEKGLLGIDGILPGLEYYLQETSGRASRFAPTQVGRGGEREPFRGTLVLISDESNSAREAISEVGGSDKKYTTVVLDQARTQRAKLATSLLKQPLPGFEGIDIEFTAEQAKGKRILVCLWDMDQRPSRNCVAQLVKRAKELKRKGVVVIAVHAPNPEKNKLDAWLKENRIPFPVGTGQGDEEETRFNWGVRALPWLILTGKEHIVQAEGFGINELDEKLTTFREK